MMTFQSLFAKPATTGTVWGLAGGFLLIAATTLTTNGLLQILPYFFILCAAILTTKYIDKRNVTFADLFKSGFLAVVISSVLLYVYVLAMINPNAGITFIGHLRRFALIVAIAMIASAIISFVAKPVK